MLKNINTVMEFVMHYHSDENRNVSKNGFSLPYFVHCVNVYKRVWLCDVCDDVTGPAALAHDTVESIYIGLKTLTEYIGEEAAKVVYDLTFFFDQANIKSKAEQKHDYLMGIRHKSLEAVVIKVCDRYENVLDFLESDPNYAYKYFKKGEPIFEALEIRKDEIIERWGPNAFDKLTNLKYDLLDKL